MIVVRRYIIRLEEMFNGIMSGVDATEMWGSRWGAPNGGPGDAVTGGDDEQQASSCRVWCYSEQMGSCPAMGADDGFQLIILV